MAEGRRLQQPSNTMGAAGLVLDFEDARTELSSVLVQRLAEAVDAVRSLETGVPHADGSIVGHYWLRTPALAPSEDIACSIREGVANVKRLAGAVAGGSVCGADGPFERVVHVGIGGSTLGPQLLCDVATPARFDRCVLFLDNADPDAVDEVLRHRSGRLGRTLVCVASKSGITPTPEYVRRVLARAYERAGLRFAQHAVATTMPGSPLDRLAHDEQWLASLPVWEWVGGRTSVTSAVGLLPGALEGADVDAFLAGAAAMDEATRSTDVWCNPAALLAGSWFVHQRRSPRAHIVLLAYRDRLERFPRYAQQLLMESLGKREDRSGGIVHAGLTLYGGKGSSDQHSFVQQLLDGPDGALLMLVATEHDRAAPQEVEAGVTLGDVLFASREGLRAALNVRGRPSISITLTDDSERSVGGLVALFERAVALYAELVDVNAYDQPAVDKFAARDTLDLQRRLAAHPDGGFLHRTADELASALGRPGDAGRVGRLLARRQPTARERVVFDAGVRDRLVDAIRARYPEKTFGYLLSHGDAHRVSDYALLEDNIRNTSTWRSRFEAYGRYFVAHDDAGFVATPEETWALYQSIWGRGMIEVGIFHSHQRHPANFSGIDFDMHKRHHPGLWHLVVSLRNPRYPRLRAFSLCGDGVTELPIEPEHVDDDG